MAWDDNPTKDQRYVALLRGVNVGGRNKLPMADLKYIFTAAGCAAVQTYIQSGNVVFKAAPGLGRNGCLRLWFGPFADGLAMRRQSSCVRARN